MHKTKLMNLINNLFNTQLVNEEIYINNEIKKESEFLNSLLNRKQNGLMNQFNPINNMNLNPFMFQLNPLMNHPQMNLNINNFQLNPPQIDNNFNAHNNENFIDLFFKNTNSSKITTIHCNENEKISDIIEKYKFKASDYSDNHYLWNGKRLNDFVNSTVIKLNIIDRSLIFVDKIGS